jgi:hypothetical protein
MIAILDPRHGAILNRHDGSESAAGLDIAVSGTVSGNAPVLVNGVPARTHAGRFSATLRLCARQTVITAVAGAESAAVTVLYDQASFARYRFSLDDNVWFLRDIAQKRYRSLFENPYMALWKRLHDAYGTKVHCNLYFQCEGFNLTQMPDLYKAEWEDNADWFRLTFHAWQNEPNKPYLSAGYAQLAHDFDAITAEIVRFAGPTVLDPFTTIHWGEATRAGCQAVRDRGIRGLVGYFVLAQNGDPAVAYYADRELTQYMATHDYWKDLDENLIFVRHDIVINSFPLADIVPRLNAVAADPHQAEIMELMIHEQYFHPTYQAYIPDYAARCETAVRWVTERGYAPVFYGDGFIGNPRSRLA